MTYHDKYTVHTYRNTEFLQWWTELNTELWRLDCREANSDEAQDAYDMGESPETAAKNFSVIWSS
jgi:hypothetical protein